MKTLQNLLLWLSAMTLSVCISTVVGDYIVEVRIHNYSNPNSLLFNHSCCDMPCHTQNARCDNVFHYCLRSINTPELNKECSGGNRSDVNDDDAPLNFSQSMVLGLPNPLPLQGLTTEWRGVQFFLEVLDDDDGLPGTGDFVGSVVHNLPSSITTLGVETEPRNFSYSLPPVRASIVLSFKVVCADGYYGPNCSWLCTENCTCDSDSIEICQAKINFCQSLNITCSGNGQCVDRGSGYSCVCDPNFTGETCSDVRLPTTETGIEAGTETVPDKNINLKAILGGAIGALVFLVLLLLLVVGALAFKLSTREHKMKGKHHALSASTDALEMPLDESEAYVDMTTQAQTNSQTIDNIAYEGITSNNEETEGATHYINEDFQSDTHVYECI